MSDTLTLDAPVGECSYRDYAAAFDRHDLNSLPWQTQGNEMRTLVVTMPDRASDMQIVRRATEQGDTYSLVTVQPKGTPGVAYGAAQKVAGFLETQRATKKVTDSTLRAHHVRIILGNIFTLPENRDADRARPAQLQNPPRERAPLPADLKSYELVNRAAKHGQLGQLNWLYSAIRVKMPIADSPLIIRPDGDGYWLDIETNDKGLEQRFTKWMEEFRAQRAIAGPFGDNAMKAALSAMGPLYSAHKREAGARLNLPALPDYDMEPKLANVPEHKAEMVIKTLREGGKVKWGHNARYGSECIRITMPNNATDLLVTRTHSNDGMKHQIYAADPVAVGADTALVQATRQWTQERTAAHGGQIDAESLRYLVEEALRQQSNQLAAKAAVGSRAGVRGV